MSQSYYKLFANCIPVKGYTRSAIYDLQRKDHWFIPNVLFDILASYSDQSLKEIKKKYIQEEIDVDEFFEFLFENEICFPCQEADLKLFPPLNLQWHCPTHFENCIVDYNYKLKDDFIRLIDEISELRIPNVQLRLFEKISEENITSILNLLLQSNIKFIDIILPQQFECCFVNQFIKSNPKIRSIIFTSSAKLKSREFEQASIFHTTQVVDSNQLCGIVEEEQFVCEMRTFCESIKFNSCLNCKISIDVDGNIKNCPSMKESFGNIKDTNIEEAIKHPNFKKYWNINKDKIEVCKDCEYRHMCTDCRAYLKQADNIFSQPAKCNYNPYIAKWKDDEGFLPVEECGSYNVEGKFIVNKEKVDSLNFELWGE
jgi:SPASM domain peptide maturase of grasp-with-spasm system